MEMYSGLEYMEKSDRTDNERDEEAQMGTEKSSRDVLMKRNRPTLESEKMSRKLEELQMKKKNIHSYSGLGASKNAQSASYLASCRIAKRGMPHTIGENLCLPVAKDIVNCMLGEKPAKTLDKIPLSDNTVARRIDSISADILSQLISRIKNSEFFSLQVDESTDVANLSNLLVYVRYLFENTVHEDFLFCCPLATHSTGEDIFNLMDSFFRVNEIDWALCVGICTDGAKSMMGRHKGAVALIRKVAPSVSCT
ncbi:hypothetical protein QQF64_029854 [Cirrhinus molitorella]|uniref:Zinc finger BED domain-containing protein 5 n=1 Tax=Cirrhinus molitorella TaxID=172907 RepID=A0ABR3N1S9_9TELE